MAMRKLIRRFMRTPASAPGGEVAGANVGTYLQPYIGELPLDPQLPARDAYSHTDETHALKVYRQTLRDERCAAALDQRLNAAIATPWEVEPGGEGAADKAAAEHLAEQLDGIKFTRICRQLLHGVWYGWAVGEAMWGRDASRVVLEDLVVRSPDRFWWSSDGELLLRTWKMPEGAPVPAGKFVLLARPGEHGDLPYAPGLARWCFWPVWMKRNGLKFWSVALEKFGAPTAVGKYPKNADVNEQKKLLSIISSLATGAGVAIPEDQVIELLATTQRIGGSGGSDFASFIAYLDRCITTTILGQSSTTDQGPWRGTAEVQKDVRDETVASDARLLDATLNETIARWLTEWNFPGAAIPQIRHDAEPPEDLDRRAKREEVITRTTGWRPTMQHIVDVYGGEWEEPPRAEPVEPGGGDVPDDAMLAASRAASIVRALARAGAEDDAVDDAVAALVGEEWEALMEPALEPILRDAAAAAARGEDLDTWRARMPALFAEMDDARLVETLHRMSFSARLSGDAGLGEDEA